MLLALIFVLRNRDIFTAIRNRLRWIKKSVAMGN